MEIEFLDPAEAPLPPDQMSFRSVEVEPNSDGQRLKVSLQVAPFQVRPSIDLTVTNDRGMVVASSSIVEATETSMSVTLHLRDRSTEPRHRLTALLVYPDRDPVDERILEFALPDPDLPKAS
jgi:hypothetical protein